MDVETALKAINDWYDVEPYSVHGITEEPKGTSENFDQSDVFISVVGWQSSGGESGDYFYGQVFFEYEKGKFIVTEF